MSDLVDVVVYGSAGRMGQAVVRAILESTQARLACALVRPGSGLADEPLDRVFGTLKRLVDFSTSLDPDVDCNVLVDFSGPVSFDAALALALQRRIAFVSGTTGLRDEQRAAFERAAQVLLRLFDRDQLRGVGLVAFEKSGKCRHRAGVGQLRTSASSVRCPGRPIRGRSERTWA